MTRERTRIAKDWKDWHGFQVINLTQNDWTFGDELAATKIFKSAQTTPCELKLIQDSPNTTANEKKGKYPIEPMRTQSKNKKNA